MPCHTCNTKGEVKLGREGDQREKGLRKGKDAGVDMIKGPDMLK